MSRSSAYSRVVVLALDGVPHSFLVREIAAGRLPAIASILQEGSLRSVASTLPSVSSVAWATFATGVHPGRHRVLGYIDRRPMSYQIFVPTAADLRWPTLWGVLSEHGKRVCVINVPIAYPPERVNGVIISGFLAPNLERATYPASEAVALQASGYRIDIDAWEARRSLTSLLRDLRETLECRLATIRRLFGREEWDFFMAHIMATDRLHHFLWGAWERGEADAVDAFSWLYSTVDGFVGEFVSSLADDVLVIFLSDHGFVTLHKAAYLNRWLKEHGWLKLRTPQATNLSHIDPSSRVFSMAPGRIYLHSVDSSPQGCVKSGVDASQLMSEVREALLEWRDPDTGEKIIERVEFGEDIYPNAPTGPYLVQLPDLVAVPKSGYELKGELGEGPVLGTDHFQGTHSTSDAFLYVRGQNLQLNPTLADLFPTVLSSLGVGVPEGVDGKALW